MLDPVLNFAKVTVSQGYDASAFVITLTAGHGAKLPNPATDGAFNLVWWNSFDYGDPSDDPNVEIVRCTSRTGDVLTVARAQEDTTATTKNTVNKTYKMILAPTKKIMDDISLRGFSVQTVSGLINGVNTTYTISSEFVGKSIISLAGQIFIQDVDYTVSGLNVTFSE